MRTKLIRVALSAVMFAAALPAMAQTNSGTNTPTPPTLEQMRTMTPQQRQDLRAQLKAMSPEQRQQFHEQMRAQRKAAWDAMTPEQKAAKKAEWQKHRLEHKAKVDAFVKTLDPAQRKAFDELHHRGPHGNPAGDVK
ncbi:Spy/CpxP family protein refolding chaperone [Roseiterribacter gracilis]|uniref:LTXXQ motif family protein n=1 Tax=Roseiterribacter gracilis TaxID=2812848 RepID=A0A8S8XI72_9PROT|nr:hypothetical protein TMPK1_32030 [Rhodospirillales bacterium TMPK1]